MKKLNIDNDVPNATPQPENKKDEAKNNKRQVTATAQALKPKQQPDTNSDVEDGIDKSDGSISSSSGKSSSVGSKSVNWDQFETTYDKTLIIPRQLFDFK